MTRLARLQLERIMSALAAERPIFHSEADFQHALAWQIRLARPGAALRLEVPREINGRRVHVDIWVSDAGERVALELKYFTRALETSVHGERFQLRDQAAQDLGRYDVLKDLARVEALVAAGDADRGFVIALTNDSSYWRGPTPLSSPNYAAFRLMEGRRVEGVLEWGAATGAGTMRGREASIALRASYGCRWVDYSDLGERTRRGQLRYLLFEHPGPSS